MPEPTTGGIQLLTGGAKALAWWRARVLRRRPIAVSIQLAGEDEEKFVLHIHADNDFHHPLEIADCFIRRTSPASDGGRVVTLRDGNLVPTPLGPPPDTTLITVPAISRRTWRLDVSRDYIQTTMAKEWAECDVWFLAPDKAARERPTCETERLRDRQRMKLWAVVVLAHRARELDSRPLRLPPFRPVEDLLRWRRKWLDPRLRSLTRR
jgi:hypothetical protein